MGDETQNGHDPHGTPDSPEPRFRSAREIYGGGSAGSSLSAALRAPRPRSGRRRVLFALAVLALLIVIASLRHHDSAQLPSGRWGRTVGCLQHNALLSVVDASDGDSIGADTIAVDVSNALHNTLLAEVAHYPSTTAATAAIGRSSAKEKVPVADYHQDGATLWAWIPGGTPPHLLSNAGERTIIAACVRSPGG